MSNQKGSKPLPFIPYQGTRTLETSTRKSDSEHYTLMKNDFILQEMKINCNT